MEIKTFDAILTKMCDDFDELIAPDKMARTNTNIVYLMFKAISKGLEVINNVCVVLSNKFDPAKCAVEDLDSVAMIVGTERRTGSGSGLQIIIKNTTLDDKLLLRGVYTYELDDETKFIFEVLEDKTLHPAETVIYMAMSDKVGSFPVTAQEDITVTSTTSIPDGLQFNCSDNSALLGTARETDLEFRNRILNGYDDQDSIIELENQLKNLPYLFDCQVRFNNLVTSVVYDDILIPAFTAIIFFSGSPRSEIANIIANKIICPTVQTSDSVPVEYHSPALLGGTQTFYLVPFRKTDFKIKLHAKWNDLYISEYDVKNTITNKLMVRFAPEVHSDFVTEEDVYDVLKTISLPSVEVLSVDLIQNDEVVDFVEVPTSRIPHLLDVTYEREYN